MIRQFLFAVLFTCFVQSISAQQFGYGVVSGLDFYSRYSNPEDNIASSSAGSALLNVGIGPKLWFGGERLSVSVEGSVVFSPFALSLGDFKGLGALAVPVLGRININGLSNLNKEGKLGLSIGGGLQWSRTELFGLQSSFSNQGVTREFFRNFIGEIGYGYGMGGFNFGVYGRYGRDADQRSNVFSIGMLVNLNSKLLKVTTDPEF